MIQSTVVYNIMSIIAQNTAQNTCNIISLPVDRYFQPPSPSPSVGLNNIDILGPETLTDSSGGAKHVFIILHYKH